MMENGLVAHEVAITQHLKKTKRYDQLPGVTIEESRIPELLQPLIPYARAWGILGDDGLEWAIAHGSRNEMEEVVRVARPLKDAIHQYAYESAGASAIPVPDEVVLFQMFAWSLNRLEVEVHRI
jgi:hypothetical protein